MCSFHNKRIKQFVGLFALSGLSSSSQIFKKHELQVKDPVSGDDSCDRTFGTRAELTLKEFKTHFAVRDQETDTLSKKEYPNWKMQEFFSRISKVNQWALILGNEVKYIFLNKIKLHFFL